MRSKITAFVLFLTLILFWCCQKSNTNNGNVPNLFVDFTIDISLPQYVKLNAIGGWVYVTGGVRGIIIYRKSQTDFVALERNCPYDPNTTCATVKVDASNIMAKDTCCKSTFLLTDGTKSSGPSTYSLKLYNTTFDGTNLRVYSNQ